MINMKITAAELIKIKGLKKVVIYHRLINTVKCKSCDKTGLYTDKAIYYDDNNGYVKFESICECGCEVVNKFKF